jgi:hypothetical protein
MPIKRASVAKKPAKKKAAAVAKKAAVKKPAAKKAAAVAKKPAKAAAKKAPPAMAAAKKAPAKKAPAKKAPAAKVAPAKPVAAPVKKAAAVKAAADAASMKKYAKRADLGAPIDAFFLKQPPELRPILEHLRRLVYEAAPKAESSLKWGMPFYTLGGNMMCAIGGHKSHVNLILSGPPGTFDDPDNLLAGDGKTGRHLKLTARDEVPVESVRGWLRTAAALASKS